MIKGTKLYLGKGRIVSFTCMGIIYALFASFAYGYSYSWFMVATILILSYSYGILLIESSKIDSNFLKLIILMIVFSMINGFIRGNVIDPIVVSSSLVLPLSISAIDIEDADNYKRYIPCCILTIILVVLQLRTSFLGEYNVNTLGFILYMGSSFGIIWLKLSSKKVYPFIYLGVSLSIMFKTDCRNGMIVMLLMIIITYLPNAFYKRRSIFRAIYIVTILYHIFVFIILEFVFKNSFTAKFFSYISSKYSSKTYSMDLRLSYFSSVRSNLSNLSVWEKIFGQGVNNGSGHNMFYQGLFMYGIVGVIIIYLFYIIVFERAYKLIIEKDDMVAFGCYIGLIGNLLLQGADEYLICNPTCVVMPFIMAGLILSRYRKYVGDRIIDE